MLIDFPFPAFPESMGHWAEVLLPVYSALVTGAWQQHVQGPSRHIDRLLLSNVRRDQLQVHTSFSLHCSLCLQRVAMLVVTADVCLLDCCTFCVKAGSPAECHVSFWCMIEHTFQFTLHGHQLYCAEYNGMVSRAHRMPLTLCALGVVCQTSCTCMVQTFEWLQAMLRISMAPGLPTGIELPQILCYDELETMDTMMWLGMQNVIIVNDRYAQADMHFALQHASHHATCTMKRERELSKVSPHGMQVQQHSQ